MKGALSQDSGKAQPQVSKKFKEAMRQFHQEQAESFGNKCINIELM